MKTRVLLAAAAVVAGAAEPALAIPAFARRYEVDCHFCHDGYPKLNAMGQRFKERGFRMAKEETFDLDAWAKSVPVVARATGTHFLFEGADDINTGVLKGVSAGNLGKRLSYWVDDSMFFTDSGDDHVTHLRPDNAWARVDVMREGRLYVKGGRIELDLPFTQARSSHLFFYDVYFANTGAESDRIGDHQDGVEVGGALPRDVHWSAAVVAGRNADGAGDINKDADKFDANLFLRLAKRINQHRVGGFAYVGRNTLVQSRTVTADDSLLRLGADASVWIQHLNLYGVAMYGRNDNSVLSPQAPGGTHQPLTFSGGFLQADWHAGEYLVLTLRGNAISRPPGGSAGSHQTFASLFPGAQFVFNHLKVSFEYGFQNRDRPDVGALQVDVAF